MQAIKSSLVFHLAPDIQEEILLPPEVMEGADPIYELTVRPLTSEINWENSDNDGKSY